jgi:hypothetical protein
MGKSGSLRRSVENAAMRMRPSGLATAVKRPDLVKRLYRR